jgi:hypothetical protein
MLIPDVSFWPGFHPLVHIVQTARKIVVDNLFRYRQYADDAGNRHQRKQIEHDRRAEQIGRTTRDRCGYRIARVIEAFVTPNPPSEGAVTDDAERHGGNGWWQDGPCGMPKPLRDRNWPEVRK